MVKLWKKPETQTFIKMLREKGYEVIKDKSGRYSSTSQGIEVFAALPGARGYLVKIDDSIVQEKAA